MKFFIEIEELKVDTIIGVFEEERLKPQTILISIKCQLDIDHNQDLDNIENVTSYSCLLYTSPSPRDLSTSRMPSSA